MKLLRLRAVRYTAGAFGLLALALFASTLVVSNQYPTEQTAERSFTIDLDYSQIRGILMSTDANEQIITLTGDSTFLDETWSVVGASLGSINPLDPNWSLQLKGNLHVRTTSDYVGQEEVWLSQDVKIGSDELVSRTELEKGSQRLLGYKMLTRYVPIKDTKQTRVEQRLTQEILTTAPWFGRAIADQRVYASAMESLVNQEAAIRKVVDDNKDKGGILSRLRGLTQ